MTDKKLSIMVLFLFLFLVGCATADKGTDMHSMAEPPVATALIGVEVGDNEVRLRADGEFKSSYTVYKPSDPYTVFVDIPGMDAKGALGTTPSTKAGVSEVTVKQEGGMARVELLLDSPSDVAASVSGDSLVLSVFRPAAEEPRPAAAAQPAEQPAEAEELPPATVINDIRFARADKMLKLVITGDGAMRPNVFRLDNRVVIDIPGVEMKAALPTQLVQPVKFMRQGMYEGRVRVVVGIEQGKEFLASTLNNTIVIDMPLTDAALAAAEEAAAPTAASKAAQAAPPMQGAEEAATTAAEAGECVKRVSLDFQDADVVPIFRFLGDICGYNVVIHPAVAGTVNLKLMNVPANQALDIILELTNLGKSFREEGRILTIASTDVFTRQKEQEAKLKQASIVVEALVEEAFTLRFINANDLLDIIKKKNMLSDRAQFYIDEITNTLEITDVEDRLKDIRKLVAKYDDPAHGTMQYGPMAQIMIEAKLVEVSTDYSRALGIRWGGTSARDVTTSTTDTTSTTGFSVNTPVASGGATTDAAGTILSTDIIDTGSVNTLNLNLSLEALESVGKTTALANPRVLALNKQAASIQQGVQIPYTVIEDGTAKTEFQSATLSLAVTPEIKPDGYVELQVTATNDSPVAVGSATGVQTQSVSTKARVKNGETLVLGGIYTNTETVSEQRVPGLGRIPLLGWLFKTQSKSESPKELLVFITPTIMPLR